MTPQIRHQQASHDAFGAGSEGVTRLAEDTSGFVKFSALLTEADAGWTLDDIRPFANHVLEAFGADRVMWGSDWPVCRIRAEYGDWHDIAQDLTSHVSASERAAIFGGTAARFYELS